MFGAEYLKTKKMELLLDWRNIFIVALMFIVFLISYKTLKK
jgi:hypothetical protein|tara:strand:- start:462 stop:584 length:123 start_codon:yes stop_codon:yes gene_type:complete